MELEKGLEHVDDFVWDYVESLRNENIERSMDIPPKQEDYTFPKKKNLFAKLLNFYLSSIADRRDYLSIEKKLGMEKLRKKGILPLSKSLACTKQLNSLEKFQIRVPVKSSFYAFANGYDEVANIGNLLGYSVVDVNVESSPLGIDLHCSYYRESM